MGSINDLLLFFGIKAWDQKIVNHQDPTLVHKKKGGGGYSLPPLFLGPGEDGRSISHNLTGHSPLI